MEKLTPEQAVLLKDTGKKFSNLVNQVIMSNRVTDAMKKDLTFANDLVELHAINVEKGILDAPKKLVDAIVNGINIIESKIDAAGPALDSIKADLEIVKNQLPEIVKQSRTLLDILKDIYADIKLILLVLTGSSVVGVGAAEVIPKPTVAEPGSSSRESTQPSSSSSEPTPDNLLSASSVPPSPKSGNMVSKESPVTGSSADAVPVSGVQMTKSQARLNGLSIPKISKSSGRLQRIATISSTVSFDTLHVDMIHDAQLDYYGTRLATCSSDRSIKIFSVQGDSHSLLSMLQGHEGPVWQVCWSHPKFGSLLASCSYDGKVYIWKETQTVPVTWTKIKEHSLHSASVNSISWAPHEYGLILACASSDGKISVLSYKGKHYGINLFIAEDGTWELNTLNAHSIGVNAVSWAPSVIPGSLFNPSIAPGGEPKRFASGGCDNLIKLWKQEDGNWKEEAVLQGHSDWVRDVAFAPNLGQSRSYLASCSQDKTVLIWTLDSATEKEKTPAKWTKKVLGTNRDGSVVHTFSDVIWRVSWSLAGNLLAVSCGDNKITVWKEGVGGDWAIVGDVNTSAAGQPSGA